MKIDTTHGLNTALVSVDEALHTQWATRRDELDVITVIDPEPASWRELRRAGFVIMPNCVTWIAPVGESEAAFVARLPANERRNVGKALRFAARNDIQVTVVSPLTTKAFDAFLDLYVPQVEDMRHGIPFARAQRTDILEQGKDYFVVQAFQHETLIGCCVCLKSTNTVLIRFTTTTPEGRDSRAVRAMYMRVFQEARELGFADVSLGTDPCLYGHIAKPGLFRFKSRLGFTPIPARIFGSFDDPDEASQVLRLDTLSEPSLLLSYDLPRDGEAKPITAETPLRLDVLTADPNTEINHYRAAFLSEVSILQIR